MQTNASHTGASDRDFLYTKEDFRFIARLAYEEAGITLPESKEMLVYSRLGKRLRALGISEFKAYCALLSSEGAGDERRKMISALTTNVTRFFREEHHFRHLSTAILPDLIARAQKGGRLRIWSAGCSTGEEAYSIAFTLLKAFPEAARFNVRILATDVDPEVIAVARRGRYRGEAASALPDWVRSNYVSSVDGSEGGIEVNEQIRNFIDFRLLNLIQPLPMKGPFDVIFCRNVTIYFDAATQDRLWEAFSRVMAPGSHLYIGHSERLSPRMSSHFATVGMTSYRLLPATAASATSKG